MWNLRFKASKQIFNLANKFGYAVDRPRPFKRCRFERESNKQLREAEAIRPEHEMPLLVQHNMERIHYRKARQQGFSHAIAQMKIEQEAQEAADVIADKRKKYVDPVWARGEAAQQADIETGGCGHQCHQCGECAECAECVGCGRCGKYVMPYLNQAWANRAFARAYSCRKPERSELELVNRHGATMDEMASTPVEAGMYALRHWSEKWFWSKQRGPDTGRVWYSTPAGCSRAWRRDEQHWSQECSRKELVSFTKQGLVVVRGLEYGETEMVHYVDALVPKKRQELVRGRNGVLIQF